MPSPELKTIISVCLSSGMSTELIVEKLMAAGYARMPQEGQMRAAQAPDMPSRDEALREYRLQIGPISVSRDDRILYPSAEKLDGTIARTERRIERICFDLREIGSPTGLREPDDPLRIEHAFMKKFDTGYRSDAEAVPLPARMLEDKRGRKIINAFLHNPEYRRNLVAAADTGVTRLFKRYTDTGFEEFVNGHREKLCSEKNRLTSLLRGLLVLRQWATEAAGKAS